MTELGKINRSPLDIRSTTRARGRRTPTARQTQVCVCACPAPIREGGGRKLSRATRWNAFVDNNNTRNALVCSPPPGTPERETELNLASSSPPPLSKLAPRTAAPSSVKHACRLPLSPVLCVCHHHRVSDSGRRRDTLVARQCGQICRPDCLSLTRCR